MIPMSSLYLLGKRRAQLLSIDNTYHSSDAHTFLSFFESQIGSVPVSPSRFRFHGS